MEEQIVTLQKEIQDLKDILQNETESTKISELNQNIEEKEKLLSELQSSVIEVTEEPRRSERARTQTEKMQAYQQEEINKKEKRLITLYEQWKILARKTRQDLKTNIPEGHLISLIDPLEKAQNVVTRTYMEIRDQIPPSTELRRKVDACEAVTKDITKIIYDRTTEIDGDYNAEFANERLRGLLQYDYARSIYGSTVSHVQGAHSVPPANLYPVVLPTNTSQHSNSTSNESFPPVSQLCNVNHSPAAQLNVRHSPAPSIASRHSSASVFMATKRADAAAELATKEAEYRALTEERMQKERIRNLKEQLKVQES